MEGGKRKGRIKNDSQFSGLGHRLGIGAVYREEEVEGSPPGLDVLTRTGV